MPVEFVVPAAPTPFAVDALPGFAAVALAAPTPPVPAATCAFTFAADVAPALAGSPTRASTPPLLALSAG